MKLCGLAFAILSLTACQSGTSDFQQVYNYCSQNGTNKNVDQVNACINYQASANQASAERRRTGLANASAILLAQGNQPPPALPPMRQPVHCTSSYNAFLKQVITNCN